MLHLDLFSGIGGFALAVDAVWQDAEHVFCDDDSFCQAVLKKHWPESKIHGDIRTLHTDTEREGYEGDFDQARPAPRSDRRPFILTGGFPCQPFSQAGRRKGTEDDRYLWPEMLRVIREFHPRWVIGENVGGLLTWNGGVVLEQVHLDLESEGYEVQAFVVPACATNAPHRRDRVWIVAHAENAIGERGGGRMESGGQILGRKSAEVENARSSWENDWIEVATRLCGIHDGVPQRLDRNSRLKALGNAIVPQVAIEIMKAIQKVESTHAL